MMKLFDILDLYSIRRCFLKPENKKIVILLILFVILLISFTCSVALGSEKIGLNDFFYTMFKEREGFIFHTLYNIRLPRTIVGLLVGICLSLSGSILQGVMRNSLASPNIIGVSSGAGLAATICIILIPNYSYLTPIASFLGAFTTTLVIYLLSYKNGIKPLRMVLAGIAVSSLISAIINLILLFFPDRVADTLSFTIGSLNLTTWADVKVLLPYAVTGFVLCFLFSRTMNVLMLGDEVANSLGVNVELSRFLFIALASLLAATSVSVVGLLGFVGLIVPHIVKLLLGSDYRYVYTGSLFLGGSIVIICDTVARVALDPAEIPVGITMSILGVPFFLFLLRGKLNSD